MADFQRSYSREDPRLNRQNSSQSPATAPPPRKSPVRDANSTKEEWDTQRGSYNHAQALQNAYQSLSYQNPNAQQYPQQTYYTGYQSYTYNPYENYQAMQAAYVNTPAEPGPPGEEYPQSSWTSSNPTYGNGNARTATQQQQQQQQEFSNNSNSAPPAASSSYKKRDDGVAEEKNKHLASLVKERETYEERVHSLKKKLKLLIDQKETLTAKGSPDRDTLRIIKENTKLQFEIQSKIKDSTNVIDILSDLIGDKKKSSKSESSEKNKDVAAKEDSFVKDEKVNYKHYDPEIHWCRMCDVFPQSAKELLLHLHSKSHQEMVQEENPWHKLPPEPKFPTYDGAAVRRLPIKGLQFFVASTAWYCRLCDSWIGDLHCASQHLMSVTHSQNYTNFVEQNPHWEMEWLKDREKALERIKRKTTGSDSEDRKKRKHKDSKYSPSAILGKEKKKKKRSKKRKKHSSDESSSSSSSSSSSDEEKEDRSKSIRVAMRNKMKLLSEGGEAKWDILEKLVEEERRRQGVTGGAGGGGGGGPGGGAGVKGEMIKQTTPPPPPNIKQEDSMMSQWVTISEPQDKDKYLLDNLKEKLKQKHDAERAKMAAEQEAARRQRDKEEAERKQREAEMQEKLAREEAERLRERMSMKMKEVKINKRDNYRQKSPSRSPDSRRRRRSRSVSHERQRRNNGRTQHDDRNSPPPPGRRYNRDRSRDRDRDHRSNNRDRSHERDRDRERDRSRDRERELRDERKAQLNKKLPFIGRMPLFKGAKGKRLEEEPPKKEIQKEEYDAPRKTRFQPGNLARAFIPQPEVVCFPQLSSYPPIPPPPPPISKNPPRADHSVKAVVEKVVTLPPPPPPNLQEIADAKVQAEVLREEAIEPDEMEEMNVVTEQQEIAAPMVATAAEQVSNAEEYMLYEDSSNAIYPYGNIDYNVMYQTHAQAAAYQFMQVASEDVPVEPQDIPKAHTMPLEPPPLPPDDPNEDLAMLGLSSDDLAVQQMF